MSGNGFRFLRPATADTLINCINVQQHTGIVTSLVLLDSIIHRINYYPADMY